MRVHLVDATYELFRAYHAPRPAVRGRSGMPLTAVAGLVGTLLALLRDEGATHVACAHDRVIRSFRNDLWPGYKTEAGVPADLLAQFPVAEEAIVALGIPLWAMVELEADDALATAALRFAADPDVEQVLVCTPDKDLAQVVRGGRVVLRDRRRDLVYDDAGVRAKWGVAPAAIPDGSPSWATPPMGSRVCRASAQWRRRRFSPPSTRSRASAPRLRTAGPPGSEVAARLAATLAERWADALLFRDLATLRLDAPLPERAADELRWDGTDRDAWETFCARWELPGLRLRPHRWRAA